MATIANIIYKDNLKIDFYIWIYYMCQKPLAVQFLDKY